LESLGRVLVLGGIAGIVLGAVLYLACKSELPLGRLPGDIRIEREGASFYLPFTTSIVISLILTVVLNIFLRLIRK
jgi:hypothetical protein